MGKKGMSMRKFNSLVRKAIQTPHRSRIRMDVGITADTLKSVQLLTVDDDPDYDVTSDGTNVSEAEALSRLQSINLNISYFSGTNGAAGGLVEWILFRSPDNALTATAPASLFTSDISPTTSMVRKNVLAYGAFYGSANNDTRLFRVRIRRAAIRRIQRLSDGDKIEFGIKNASGITGAKFFMWGTITWSK